MKKDIFFAFLILFTVFTSAQDKIEKWKVEELADISILLYRQITPKTAKTGTGTIVNHGNRYFLLTASHVAKNMDSLSHLVFRLKGDKPYSKKISILTKEKNVSWIHHKIADIAIIELKIPDDPILLNQYYVNSFPISQINPNRETPTRSMNIIYYGYPVLDLKLNHFSALSFDSHLSSGLITSKRGDTKTNCDLFFLESPSIQGCSGSGVYVGVEKIGVSVGPAQTILVGVMHGTFSDNTGGKLAIVTPSFYIFDFFK